MVLSSAVAIVSLICIFLMYRFVDLPAAPAPLSPASQSALKRNSSASVTVSLVEEKLFRRPKIPHSLVFIHTKLRSLEQLPSPFRENVQNTIRLFRSGWEDDDEEAPVRFLNDSLCADAIQRTEPRLLPYYRSPQTLGKFQADICRVAYLYISGGFYFDVDMKTLQPLRLPGNVTFSSAITDGSDGNFNAQGPFFQSILASAPGHPILGKALEMMLGYYNGTLKICGGQWVGPCTLRRAYDRTTAQERGVVRILRETNLESRPHVRSYPNLTRQQGRGCCCNFVVHDDVMKDVYFFSRVSGSGEYCRAS